MAGEPRAWRLSVPPGPYFQFDDATVVYNPLTGETHFLAELPALLLEQMSDRFASLPEILARFGAEEELDAAALARIERALTQLEAAELIQASDPEVPVNH